MANIMDFLGKLFSHPAVAVLVAVVGWLLSDYLARRAQRKAFKNHVSNDARLDIHAELTRYMEWLAKVYAEIGWLDGPPEVSVDSVHKKLRGLVGDRATSSWVGRLEQYELLYPGTAKVRLDLLARGRSISDDLHKLLILLLNPEERPKSEPLKTNIMNQLGLIQDVMIHLQNSCLEHIAGRRVPERVPTSPTVPWFKENRHGILELQGAD